ncbi:CLUMA_CG021397, isoform A [Clunio marinus]|uniref:CLUMA_CG021397, isoform A n=1 Tax=Clunio marinus TaxID=568069 RepID=A0A1J1J8S0_9DIPT|nr:CLUMA_CG021397, isoform A [Clunio marinus]
MKVLLALSCLFLLLFKANGKYVEGHIKTHEDWVFLSRFCFLSEAGRYEYFIEYDRKYGDLQLLLYYDEPHQWPSVYKTSKTCQEKVSVLAGGINQIVTLSAKNPYFMSSGCSLRTASTTRSETKESLTTHKPSQTTSKKYPEDFDSTYFDQFIKTTMQASPSTTFPPLSSIDMSSTTFTTFNFTDKVYVTCHNAGGFTSARQRWWYIALANCGNAKGMDVRFKFRMTNGPPGDFWHEHFSADEMCKFHLNIPPIIMAEIILYTFLLLAIFACGIELKTRHLYHCTYRLYTFSAILHWSGVLLNSVTWAKYAVSGIGPFTIFGGLFTGSGEIAFLLLMLLMAKGYTITRARLSTLSTVKITVFINLYIVVFISLYIYQAEAFDPGEVLNLYESAAGYALAGLRCFGWAFFVISCTTTVKKFPEKRNFYFPFGILGSIWIMSGPMVIFLVVALLDPWVRESLVYLVNAFIAFCGYAYFLWLTWPSRANKSFPYHVKTNHIGIASDDDDGADYPRHTYEPGQPDATIIIPLSRRTEDLVTGVGGIYNPGFVRDVEYFRNSGPLSIPQQCFPSKNVHHRLPSPTNGPPTLTNNKIYGNDILNHDEDDDDDDDSTDGGVETAKIDANDAVDKRISSVESEAATTTTAAKNEFPSRHSSQDNDSGHLSLEASGSPNSNDVSTTPVDNSLQPSDKPQTPFPLPPIFKENPFKVHTKAPSKIILDPIKLPTNIHNGSANTVTAHTNVPRHLFTIKKSGQ